MRTEFAPFMAILGMAFVTYLTRIAGLWLMNRVTLTPRLKSGLNALPGAILVSIIAPSFFASGYRNAIAGLITAVVAYFSKSLLAAMIAGVGSVWILRQIGYAI